ncbi:hypothetical protein HYU23_01585 [Candidatus Woesearchaeota archaeon]|nr:hypothetical protein [Candidatus Woesearchaeota archaeon]
MEESKEVQSKIKSIGIAWITFIVVLLLTILTFILAPLFISGILFISVYLPAMLYILIYKWIKMGFASVFFAFSVWLNILILIIPLLGGILALDLMQFSEDFSNNPKYILLEDNNLIFGLKLNINNKDSGEQFSTLTSKQLIEIENDIIQKNKDKVIFVLKKEVFRNVNEIYIKDLKLTATKEDIFELLKSDDPIPILTDKLPKELTQGLSQEALKQQFQNTDQIKTMAFLLLLEKTLEKEGPKYLIDELKNGNIKIYPERISINILIKILPSDLISSYLPEIPSLSGSEIKNSEKILTY